VRSFEAYRRDDSGFECFLPWLNTDAPAIAGLETGKIVFRVGSDEIVSNGRLMSKELFGDNYTNCVTANILLARVTFPITIETRQRIRAASLQNSAKNVFHHIETDYPMRPGIYFWALWAKSI
jgi:hypothetical protein